MDKTTIELADRLIEAQKDRNEKYDMVDNVYNGVWDLPPGMPEWVQKVVMMDGHDAVATASRVMSQWNGLRVSVLPQQKIRDAKQRANDISQALKWQLRAAMRRNDSNLLHDIAFSAVQYAMTAVEVVYLPYQQKIIKDKGDTPKWKYSQRLGDFTFSIHHPGNVYPLYSMYGLEGVLIVKVQSAQEFVADWGKKARGLIKKDDENKELWVTSYDYKTHARRKVWGVVGSRQKDITLNKNGENSVIIMDDENELGFIPVAVRRYGNSLSSNSAERVNPLLGTMATSKQYDMLNIFASMDGTLAWKRAAAPAIGHESPTGEMLQVDATEPYGVAESEGGRIVPLPSLSVDQRLSNQYINFRSQIAQSTVTKILSNLDFPSGTAAAAVNQVLDAAIGSLSPYKVVQENTLADIFHLMLCSLRNYGDKFKRESLYGEGAGKGAGEFISIPSDELEPDAVRIEVIITPDIPLDEQARANTAVMLYRDFPIPASKFIEDLGYEDPQELIDDRQQEDLDLAYAQVEKERPSRDMEEEYQLRLMDAQAGVQQEQQEQQEQQAQATPPAATQAATPATEALGGLENNPALGAASPTEALR